MQFSFHKIRYITNSLKQQFTTIEMDRWTMLQIKFDHASEINELWLQLLNKKKNPLERKVFDHFCRRCYVVPWHDQV